jgi:hypothetical protein
MKRFFLLTVFAGIIVLLAVLYCFSYYQFWTHIKTDQFNSLAEYEGSNIRGYRGRQILVNKDFIDEMNTLNLYAAENDLTLIVNQGFRYKDPKGSGNVVEPVDNSNHKAGYAIDFNIVYNGKKYLAKDLKRQNLSRLPRSIQSFIQQVRNHHTLRWGGDFHKQDPVHVDQHMNTLNRSHWAEQKEMCVNDYRRAGKKWKFWQ